MKSSLFFVLAFTLTVSNSFARGPAVEDFVGVESESPDVTPEGTEALFNFEQEVTAYAARPIKPSEAVIVHHPVKSATTSTSWPLSAWFGVFFVLGLPVATWALTMRHLKTRHVLAKSVEELPSNVTALPTRKPVETKNDDIKKAS